MRFGAIANFARGGPPLRDRVKWSAWKGFAQSLVFEENLDDVVLMANFRLDILIMLC